MDNLIKSYYDWLKDNTVINKIGDYFEESTPFLDMYNDSISLYHKKLDNGDIRISDGGYIESEFELIGLNVFRKGNRKEQFERLLNSYGLDFEDDEIYVIANESNYKLKKHFLIQGILRIEDMYLLSKSNIKYTFYEDVIEFMDTLEVPYSDDIKITGKSKMDQHIDLIIPFPKKEKIVKFANNLNTNTLNSNLFIFQDIKGIRKREEEFYLLVNDENFTPKKEHLEALQQYNINVLYWSDKESVHNQFKNIV